MPSISAPAASWANQNHAHVFNFYNHGRGNESNREVRGGTALTAPTTSTLLPSAVPG